jgi:hypothetical protein
MSRKARIHQHIHGIANEILNQIKETEGLFPERWVPAIEIKEELDLNFASVPQANRQYGPKGWLFAIAARSPEDKDLVEYEKVGSRAFYRSK